MATSITFRDVSFSYEKDNPLFQNFNVSFPIDKTILLKGENGIGKSTLASLAAGLLKPSAGNVNYSIISSHTRNKYEIYRHLSYLRQNNDSNVLGVNPTEDLKLWLLSDSNTVNDTDKRIDTALSDWDLTDKKTTPVWELSAGELKSLALAGLNMFNDRYWILDEPLASLDKNHVNRLLEMLRQKQSVNRGMLIISHQSDLFTNLVDEVLTMYPQGSIRKEL